MINKLGLTGAIQNLQPTNSKNIPSKSLVYIAGRVTDIILDENHSEFKNNKIDSNNWPADSTSIIQGFPPPVPTDDDYSWLGRALIRPIYSFKNVEKEHLIWARPLDSNVSEYPLINEVVSVVKYLNKYFYTKLNLNNFRNNKKK